MRTIRGRLTLWYAVALVATVLVFATVIYSVQRSQSHDEFDSRLRLESDLIAAVLIEAARAGQDLIVRDSITGQPSLAPQVADLFRGVPGFAAVVLRGGEVLFVSAEARAPSFPAVPQLFDLLAQGDGVGTFGSVTLEPPLGGVRYFVRPVHGAGPNVAGVAVGVPTAGVELAPRRLLSAMLLTAPFIIVASIAIGYALVGRTLAPVDRIVDEVEAISDGRSLHRRLAFPEARDELARLTLTLNQMLGRLERSFMLLRRFTADASHELKTPLTVLRSGVERAITHPHAPADLMEVLEELLIEVNRMSEMVDSLLTLARADEGRAPLHLEEVDLREILADAAETANILGEHASVEVEVSVPREAIPMRADRSRLRQLLMNLLTNAIKYTPAGGNVWIGTTTPDGQVVLTVRDSGIGIAPGDLLHVFDRFWRADNARSRTGDRPGAGLGLAICKWIAEAHGGSIGVQSRPGRGTAFTVTLPLEGNDRAAPSGDA
jgi:two-component system OmpR family sensor kinase